MSAQKPLWWPRPPSPDANPSSSPVSFATTPSPSRAPSRRTDSGSDDANLGRLPPSPPLPSSNANPSSSPISFADSPPLSTAPGKTTDSRSEDDDLDYPLQSSVSRGGKSWVQVPGSQGSWVTGNREHQAHSVQPTGGPDRIEQSQLLESVPFKKSESQSEVMPENKVARSGEVAGEDSETDFEEEGEVKARKRGEPEVEVQEVVKESGQPTGQQRKKGAAKQGERRGNSADEDADHEEIRPTQILPSGQPDRSSVYWLRLIREKEAEKAQIMRNRQREVDVAKKALASALDRVRSANQDYERMEKLHQAERSEYTLKIRAAKGAAEKTEAAQDNVRKANQIYERMEKFNEDERSEYTSKITAAKTAAEEAEAAVQKEILDRDASNTSDGFC